MSKCTLLVDGNWLLLSRAFAIGNAFNKEDSEEIKRADQESLEDTLSRSLTIILNRFTGVVDNIILIADGGSWRKKLEAPDVLLQSGIRYKGNRDEGYQEKDYDYIFGALNNLLKNCEKAGMTVSRGLDIEGDDWIWYWSRKLNAAGNSCIIWSSDNDLKQLVQSVGSAFTAWYNDKRGLFLHKSLHEEIKDDLDFFLTSTESNPVLDKLISQVKSVEYIDPDAIIEDKIITGDMSDNIKPIVHGKKGERNISVSSKEWEKIKESLNIFDLPSFFENTDKIISNILECRRLKVLNVSPSDAKSIFEYNTKLVWLHKSQIPARLVEEMDKTEYKRFDVDSVKNNYKVLVDRPEQTNSIEQLFEGVF